MWCDTSLDASFDSSIRLSSHYVRFRCYRPCDWGCWLRRSTRWSPCFHRVRLDILGYPAVSRSSSPWWMEYRYNKFERQRWVIRPNLNRRSRPTRSSSKTTSNLQEPANTVSQWNKWLNLPSQWNHQNHKVKPIRATAGFYRYDSTDSTSTLQNRRC